VVKNLHDFFLYANRGHVRGVEIEASEHAGMAEGLRTPSMQAGAPMLS
jgi:hypothetical protein